MKRLLAFGLILLLRGAPAHAAETGLPPADDAAVGRELEAIRDQLIAMDIEDALAALDALLVRPALPDLRRVEGYDLRAQGHAASDDLKAAENDYRAILQLNAAYVPNAAVTSKKAMDRFVKLKAGMVGTLHLDLDPKDASLAVDERPVVPSADGSLAAVAGERRLHVTRTGFDPLDTTVHAVAGVETLVKIRMVPNARGIVVRTDVEGVAVTLDGVPAGATARLGGPVQSGDASLSIADVAIGEHQLEFAKPCYATETLEEFVTVDLTDRAPKVLRLVAMRPARTRVEARGADYSGELRVDGAGVASLPLSSFTLCPGSRVIEVSAAGRIVWSGSIVAEATDLTLDLAPRPNVVLVGAAWPQSWVAAAAGWSPRTRIDPPAGIDLTAPSGWERIPLPPGTDLVVGVIPDGGLVGEERTVLYSPSLRELEDHASPPSARRPSWRQATIGVKWVDAGAKSVIAAFVVPGGPAAKAGLQAGDRLTAVGGHTVADAAAARDAVDSAGIGAPLSLEIPAATGGVRRIECVTDAEPRRGLQSDDRAGRIVRAAWAAADAAAAGPDSVLAIATLAGLLEGSGRDQAALEAWRRVRSGGDARLAARAAYAIGVALAGEGKRPEAIEAFGQARSEALASSDPILASAAADRLADLGVAAR